MLKECCCDWFENRSEMPILALARKHRQPYQQTQHSSHLHSQINHNHQNSSQNSLAQSFPQILPHYYHNLTKWENAKPRMISPKIRTPKEIATTLRVWTTSKNLLSTNRKLYKPPLDEQNRNCTKQPNSSRPAMISDCNWKLR